MTKRQIVVAFLLGLIGLMIFACGAELGHADTTDALPRVVRELVAQENPNMAIVGNILAGELVFAEDGRAGTALRIHPKGMYGLFDTTITFCGDVSSQVAASDGALTQGDLVFLYKRQAGRLINGVPCFELRSVDHVLARRTPPWTPGVK
jgi:hypothetical protein